MYANVWPGLDHCWRHQSYDMVDVVGSTAAGWFTLPHTRDCYTGLISGSNYSVMLDALYDDPDAEIPICVISTTTEGFTVEVFTGSGYFILRNGFETGTTSGWSVTVPWGISGRGSARSRVSVRAPRGTGLLGRGAAQRR